MCYDVKRHKHMPSIVLLSFIIVVNATFAGVTGKIAGLVTDSQNKAPVIGANVYIENQQLGAATDQEGQYFILNIFQD